MPFVPVRLADLAGAAHRACLALSGALVPLAARTGDLGLEADVRRAWLAGSLVGSVQQPDERLGRALDCVASVHERLAGAVMDDIVALREGDVVDLRARACAAAEGAVKALCALVDYWRAAGDVEPEDGV